MIGHLIFLRMLKAKPTDSELKTCSSFFVSWIKVNDVHLDVPSTRAARSKTWSPSSAWTTSFPYLQFVPGSFDYMANAYPEFLIHLHLYQA